MGTRGISRGAVHRQCAWDVPDGGRLPVPAAQRRLLFAGARSPRSELDGRILPQCGADGPAPRVAPRDGVWGGDRGGGTPAVAPRARRATPRGGPTGVHAAVVAHLCGVDVGSNHPGRPSASVTCARSPAGARREVLAVQPARDTVENAGTAVGAGSGAAAARLDPASAPHVCVWGLGRDANARDGVRCQRDVAERDGAAMGD
mmetsp:Transcript_29453/g.77191  ORF Transcript_29453/g.77191 Transcript_29453/m.77191 type:complete len:203 (+) Transcript_29453:394-1002(+)